MLLIEHRAVRRRLGVLRAGLVDAGADRRPRALQGLGGGGLRAVSQATLADIIPPRERGRYQGYFAGVFVTANALGPVLGGFFADDLSWHWIFLDQPAAGHRRLCADEPLPAPAQAAAAERRDRLVGRGADPRLDDAHSAGRRQCRARRRLGLAAGVGPDRRGRGPDPCASCCASGWRSSRCCRCGFSPMPVFTVSILITILVQIVMTALLVIVPLNYQLVAGLSPDRIGILLVPLTVGSVVGSAGSGALISRTGRYRIFPLVGNIVASLTCAAIGVVGTRPLARLRRRRDQHSGHRLGRAVLAAHHRGAERAPLAGHRDRPVVPDVLPPDRRRLRRRDLHHHPDRLALTAGALAVPGHEALGAQSRPGASPSRRAGAASLAALTAALAGTIARRLHPSLCDRDGDPCAVGRAGGDPARDAAQGPLSRCAARQPAPAPMARGTRPRRCRAPSPCPTSRARSRGW